MLKKKHASYEMWKFEENESYFEIIKQKIQMNMCGLKKKNT